MVRFFVRLCILAVFISPVCATRLSWGQTTRAIRFESDEWLARYPKDKDGFTIFPVPGNAVIVGSQPGDAPTFRKAQRLAIENGSYCVLFRRGRVYSNSQIEAGEINDSIQGSGTSDRPFIVGSVGDPSATRPLLLQGFGIGGPEYGQWPHDIIVFGLDFYGDERNPASPSYTPKAPDWYQSGGLRMIDGSGLGNHLWIEDCRFRFLGDGIELQANKKPFVTAIIRRCTIDHCYGEKYGMYAYNIKDLLVTECFFDHNGWVEGLQGQGKNIFTHDLYVQTYPGKDDPQTRVLDTIFARAASTGCQQRSGGLNDGCAYIGDPIAGFVAFTPNSTWSNSTVCAAGFDMSTGAANRRGWGVQLNLVPSGTLDHIVCFDKPQPNDGDSGFAFQLMCTDRDRNKNVPMVAELKNLIVHNWTSWKSDDGIAQYVVVAGKPASITYSNCDLPGFGDLKSAPSYVDPERTLASYAATLNVEKITDPATFLAAAAKNRKGEWDARLTAPAFNAYIFEGFSVGK